MFGTKKIHKTKKRKTFKYLNCSPAMQTKSTIKDSCLPSNVIDKLKREYNKDHVDKIAGNNPKDVLQQLQDKITECETEECLLNEIDDVTMRNKMKKFIFAPKHPKEWLANPREWLSNIDIEQVIRQYEIVYPDFKFIGPTTIDFDSPMENSNTCVENELCKFSLKKMQDLKKTKIGIIFNLDKHTESGSHWVSLFIDIENKFLFFFDSVGTAIPKEIKVLMKRIKEQGKEMDISFTSYDTTGVEHQMENTECGMYSLFFMITLLTGKTPYIKKKLPINDRIRLFMDTKIPDKMMVNYRKLYFN